MTDEQLRDRRVATLADPQLRDYKVVGGLDTFANRSFWPNFFSKLVARLQWNPSAIDLTPDAREWPRLPAERRRRLKTLLPASASVTISSPSTSRRSPMQPGRER